jgi:hypothetical protein
MLSAKPPIESSVATTLGLHRTPEALADVIPEKVVVTATQVPNTTTVRSWFGLTYHFYLVGSSTWAAQFSVDGNGHFTLFVYSAVDPSLTGCVYTVLDQTNGVLVLGHDAHGAPYLSFPPTSGTETIDDGCGLGGGGTRPFNYNYAWYITPYYTNRTAWVFSNSKYSYPFNKFVFRSGPLNEPAAETAASSAADRLKAVGGRFV